MPIFVAARLLSYPRERLSAMIDFFIGLAYVAIVLTPAIVASVQLPKSHSGDL
jgi:hypothetical protein